MARLDQEKRIIAVMVRVYCQAHHQEGILCDGCSELLIYANMRLDRCSFAENKPSCRKCPHHCYNPNMRERIRAVMKYAGPRMIYLHPITALKHILLELRG